MLISSGSQVWKRCLLHPHVPTVLLNPGNPTRNGTECVESRLFLDRSNSTLPKDSFTECFVGTGELNTNL